MHLLDSGLGFIIIGLPLAALTLTLIVTLIEAIYLNVFLKRFWNTFWKILLANFLSGFVGFILFVTLNVTGVLDQVEEATGISMRLKDGAGGYAGRMILIVIFYLITVAIELPLLKKMLKRPDAITTNKILIANAISYLVLGILFFQLD